MEKKNQHVIPECYLKAWGDPATPEDYTPYVWVHTRDGSSTRRRAPKKLFTETDFYTVKLDDGSRSLVIEDSFSVIEDRFARFGLVLLRQAGHGDISFVVDGRSVLNASRLRRLVRR